MEDNKPKQSNRDRLLKASPIYRYYTGVSDRIAWKQSRLYRNLSRLLIIWLFVLLLIPAYLSIINVSLVTVKLASATLIIIFIIIIIVIAFLKDRIVDQAPEEVIVENLNKIEKFKIDNKILFTPKKIYKIIGIIFGVIFALAALGAILGSIFS